MEDLSHVKQKGEKEKKNLNIMRINPKEDFSWTPEWVKRKIDT